MMPANQFEKPLWNKGCDSDGLRLPQLLISISFYAGCEAFLDSYHRRHCGEVRHVRGRSRIFQLAT